MGTRGAVGFKLDQKEVIFYNHFDSYPDALGEDVVNYVKSVTNWDSVRDKVTAFEAVDETTVPTKGHIDRAYYAGTVNLGVGGQSEKDWYCLTREAQGDLGKQLNLGFGVLSNDFPYDSLFCEYAYIINLDTMELEFYEGFNHDRNANGRYAKGLPPSGNDVQDGYGGVVLKGEAPLNAIPEDWEVQFYPSLSEDE